MIKQLNIFLPDSFLLKIMKGSNSFQWIFPSKNSISKASHNSTQPTTPVLKLTPSISYLLFLLQLLLLGLQLFLLLFELLTKWIELRLNDNHQSISVLVYFEGSSKLKQNKMIHLLLTFALPRGMSTVASFAVDEPENTGSCGRGDIVFTCGTLCIQNGADSIRFFDKSALFSTQTELYEWKKVLQLNSWISSYSKHKNNDRAVSTIPFKALTHSVHNRNKKL